jgi:two-component system, cell cycle sensor histidine kinase and response regulator CckA
MSRSDLNELAQSGDRFKAVIDAFADPLLIVDRHNIVRYVNAAVARVLAHRPQDVLARELKELLHPDEHEKIYADLAARAAPGANLFLEHRVRRGDGGFEIAETTATTLDDPTGRLLRVLHVRCVTERHRAEEALRKSEALLKEAQRLARVASWHEEPHTKRRVWSSELYRILDADPAAESSDLYFEAIHPEDIERVRTAFAAAENEKRPFKITHRMLTKKGALRHVEVRGELLADERGELHSLGTIQDITERTNLAAQLRQREKMETVGQLAAGAAHDFNNLLTVINGIADLEASALPPDDSHRAAYEAILEAGQRAAALTQQLLAFGRKQILQPIELSLSDTVTRLAPVLRKLLGERIAIVTHTPIDLGSVRADPTQIDQVLLNLAVNARDAMPDGGTLTIETADVVLDDTYAETRDSVEPGAYVMLAVSDTGCGMDERTRERMFEPFFTTKAAGKGTGLGLATVYGIVKQSGGEIWCYSELGNGTTFKVYLPRVASAEVNSTIKPAPAGGHETILVVDDDRALRPLAKRILERKGYKVLVAGSAEEALKLVSEHSGDVHLVLADVLMPGMDGVELAERLTALRPNLRVLYTSGMPRDGAPFIAKPYTAQMLTRKVREVLDG